MAEPAIALGATDFFAMPAAFVEQASSTNDDMNAIWYFEHLSNPYRQTWSNPRRTVQVEYKYTGDDLATDLGSVATNLRNQNGWQIDLVNLTFSASDFPIVAMTGHRHHSITGSGRSAEFSDSTVGSHNSVGFNWSAAIPETSGGVGIGNITNVNYQLRSGTNTQMTNLIITAETTHLDVLGHDRLQVFGGNIALKVMMSVAGVGSRSLIADDIGSAWRQTHTELVESNSDFDAWVIDAETYFSRN